MKFILIYISKIGLVKHGSLFNDVHFVANDLLKLSNTMKACLINLNILYFSFSLNIHEYRVYLLFQLHYEQVRNHKQCHLMKFHSVHLE